MLPVNRVTGNREERQNGSERQCHTEDVLSDQISAASTVGKEGGKREKNPTVEGTVSVCQGRSKKHSHFIH